MSKKQPSRKKYVLLKLQVLKENKRYVTAVADILNLPINEVGRRVFSDAEARRLFLPDDFQLESISLESIK